MRRVVRLDVAFLFALDDQLGDERGSSGQPSTADVLVLDLPSIIEVFATNFDDLHRFDNGGEDYRYFVTTGVLFRAATVTGQLLDEDTVVLIDIELEL